MSSNDYNTLFTDNVNINAIKNNITYPIEIVNNTSSNESTSHYDIHDNHPYMNIDILKELEVKATSNNCLNEPNIIDNYTKSSINITINNKPNKLDILIAPKNSTIYKGMDTYLDPDFNFTEKKKTSSYWFGDKYIANYYSFRYFGTINAYNFTKNTNLLLWNKENIIKLYDIINNLIKNNSNNQLYLNIKKAFQLKTGIDINPVTRLQELIEFSKSKNPWKININDKPSAPLTCSFKFDGIINEFGHGITDRLVYNFLHIFNNKIGIDGIIAPQSKSIYMNSGYNATELILHNLSTIKRNPLDKYDWWSWKDKLDFTLPSNKEFIYDNLTRNENINHRMVKFYINNLDDIKFLNDTINHRYNFKPINQNKPIIISTLNTHFQRSLNTLHTDKDCVDGMFAFINKYNITILCLQEVINDSIDYINDQCKKYNLFNSYDKNDYNINNQTPLVISKFPFTKINKILLPFHAKKRNAIIFEIETLPNIIFACVHLEYIRVQKRNIFSATNKELYINKKHNTSIHFKQLKSLLQHNPDIILGDFNFDNTTPEYHYLMKLYNHNQHTVLRSSKLKNNKLPNKHRIKGSQEWNYTTPYNNTTDYVFYKKYNNKHYVLNTSVEPYLYSDHRPVISEIYNENVDQLIFNKSFIKKNQNNQIIQFYFDNLQQSLQEKNTKELYSNKFIIGTLNVHFLRSINIKDTAEQCVEEIFKFIDKYNITLLGIQEYSRKYDEKFKELLQKYHMYSVLDNYDSYQQEPGLINLFISKIPMKNVIIKPLPSIDERKNRVVVFCNLDNDPKLYACTHLELYNPRVALSSINELTEEMLEESRIKNFNSHKLQLDYILSFKPDILLGDMNFNRSSSEYEYMKDKMNHKQHNSIPTTPFRTLVDYIFYDKRIEPIIGDVEVKPYAFSDHKPVIMTLNKPSHNNDKKSNDKHSNNKVNKQSYKKVDSVKLGGLFSPKIKQVSNIKRLFDNLDDCQANNKTLINQIPKNNNDIIYYSEYESITNKDDLQTNIIDYVKENPCKIKHDVSKNNIFINDDTVNNYIKQDIYQSDDYISKLTNSVHYAFDLIKKTMFISIRNNKIEKKLLLVNFDAAKDILNQISLDKHDDNTYITTDGCRVQYKTLTNNTKPQLYEVFEPMYIDMFNNLLENRKISDCDFILCVLDQQVLLKNGKDPRFHFFGSYDKLLDNYDNCKFLPIFTIGSNVHFADIPLPNHHDWDLLTNNRFMLRLQGEVPYCFDIYDQFKNNNEEDNSSLGGYSNDNDINTDWDSKIPTAIFRGHATGCPETFNKNKRINAALLSQKTYNDPKYGKNNKFDGHVYLDAKIINFQSSKNKRKLMKDNDLVVYNKESTHLKISGNKYFMSMKEQSKYKYILNIEGFVAAFRLTVELSYNSVILLVDSDYGVWYSHMLIPFNINTNNHADAHYIPIKEDLSDLLKIIDWCKHNDDTCKTIANNGLEFYNKYLKNKDTLYDYMECIMNNLSCDL